MSRRKTSQDARHLLGWSRIAVSTVAVAVALLLLAGCDNMSDGARVKPLEPSAFFEDGASSRPLVEGTIARGQLGHTTDPFHTGRDAEGMAVARAPMKLDAAVLLRGQERYNIHCSPCHGQTGVGDGMIFQRGFPKPGNLTEDRLRAVADGHIFDVITNGFGKMLPFGSRIAPEDRWAIVLYVRALQLSQHADMAVLDAQDVKALGDTTKPTGTTHSSPHDATTSPEGQ